MQGEGGKWICDPYKIQAKVAGGAPCLVYSVGSNGQFDFEIDIHNVVSPHCEIHTFDKKHWSEYKRGPPPKYVHYHVYTVGLPPSATPMSTIVKELGHEGR